MLEIPNVVNDSRPKPVLVLSQTPLQTRNWPTWANAIGGVFFGSSTSVAARASSQPKRRAHVRKLSCGHTTEHREHTWEIVTRLAATCHQRGQDLVHGHTCLCGLARPSAGKAAMWAPLPVRARVGKRLP
jgi:hypothetical protein